MASTTNTPSDDTILANLYDLFMSASPAQIQQGIEWYSDASAVAQEMIRLDPTLNLEKAASIISAFSPRGSWAQNKRKALRYAACLHVGGLRNCIKMASESRILGFEALKGPKTNAFARNIAGDLDAVTVDSWMMRAAGFESGKSPTVRQYRSISSAVRMIASSSGLAPAHVQAIIWIVKRGKSE